MPVRQAPTTETIKASHSEVRGLGLHCGSLAGPASGLGKVPRVCGTSACLLSIPKSSQGKSVELLPFQRNG